MTNLKFFKVYIMMLLGMSVSSIFGAFDFTTNYNNSDALYWQGKSTGSLDASKKAVLQTNVVDLINNRASLEPWQLSYAQDLVSRLANASFFSATEKADYTNQLTTLSAPPPPSYKSVATRLTELQGRINKISGTLAQTDISVITTELQNLLPELYGSERDKGTFIMTIRSLKSKATFARVSTASLDQMETNLKTITNSNRITFLERAVSDDNFKDQTERDLFVAVAKMLRELMDKLSNDEITRFHTSIVSSLNSPNFTEEDKKYLWALGSEVVDYFIFSFQWNNISVSPIFRKLFFNKIV